MRWRAITREAWRNVVSGTSRAGIVAVVLVTASTALLQPDPIVKGADRIAQPTPFGERPLGVGVVVSAFALAGVDGIDLDGIAGLLELIPADRGELRQSQQDQHHRQSPAPTPGQGLAHQRPFGRGDSIDVAEGY